MDVYQLQISCQSCGADNKVILSAGVSSATCRHCSTAIVRAKRFAGVIYVMSNPRVAGVKIGMTRENAFRRAKQISGTGVPGDFVVAAVFPSHNPVKDERKVHQKLSRCHISKEHFELDPIAAVAKVRTVLGRDPAYVATDLEKALADRIQEQRERTSSRFKKEPERKLASISAKENTGKEDDLFAAMEREPRPAKTLRQKGFLANLFTQ